MGKVKKKILALTVLSVFLVQTVLTMIAPAAISAATTDPSIFTEYLPEINETIDESGFLHPGVGLTKEILENVRTQVRAQKEPWYSYFKSMEGYYSASRDCVSANQNSRDSEVPNINAFNSQGFNSRFKTDGIRAYTQALMYYITGDEAYRSNAMHIIRIWSHMDPTKYARFTDCHIHTGMPLYRMVTAAEIMRYTSCQTVELEWTDQDTADFTNNLIIPVTETFNYGNGWFMNQHLYPLIGSVSGYIFTGNKARYEQAVEWFTVNKTAVDQGQNGAIKQLFRLVDTNADTGEAVDPPVVELAEAGRDQAHSQGDVINVSILSRLLMGQGTKVDPVEGTVSTADNAVGPYEFLNDRILAGANFFAKYMLGYNAAFIPVASHTDADGNPTVIYRDFGGWHRGRVGGECYDLYYYYKYEKGINVEEIAPYFAEMFQKRYYSYWESQDAGGEYWLYIPKEAEAEGSANLPKDNPNPVHLEMEYRTTLMDNNSAILQEGDTSFVRVTATPEGSRIALVDCDYGTSLIGLKIRTSGSAKLEAFGKTISLPDTKGEWKYITYPSGLGEIEFFTIKGDGVTVDIDHINVNAGTELTAPVFTAGNAALNIFTYLGSSLPIQCDFSATDTNTADILTYTADHLPEGAVLNASTGAFTWTPVQPGTYDIIIKATDGTTISTRNVHIVVGNDRKSAVDIAAAGYNPDTVYVSSTVDHYNKVYQDVMSQIQSASDEAFHQKLLELYDSVLSLSELTPRLPDGSMNYVNMPAWSNFYGEIGNLVTGSPQDFAGYYNAINLTFYMDFGADFKISADAFELQARSGFPERGAGITIFGSNDNENWTRLTPGVTVYSEDMQRLEVQEELKDKQFRFIKIQTVDHSYSMLELGEFRIYGERYETDNKITSVSISSDQSVKKRIVNGDTVKLTFQSREAIHDVSVTIMGQNAAANSTDGLNWTALAVMGNDVPTGNVKFEINYKTLKGIDAEAYRFTTDGTSLFFSNESDLINDIAGITNIIDPTATWGRPDAAETIKQVNYLFDDDINTVPHFFDGSSGAGYVTFDFKAGNQVLLSSAEVIGRQDAGLYSRIGGAVVQGSNDNTTWTTISSSAAATPEWKTLTINSTVPYRYIRLYNNKDWYVNIAELKLHGKLQTPLKDALKQAASIDKNIYTAESLLLLEQAVAAATPLVDSISATQAEADTAVSNLQAALAGLQYIPGMPVLAALTDQTIVAGNKLTFPVQAVNTDAEVEYRITDLPAGASFDTTTHTFTWKPRVEQGGIYAVTFTAASSGLSSSKTIHITAIGQPVIEA
ncbi:MAG TPA: putative Ig domain-containing protein, partial [Mobilitalea sp.]|nr:putative Ig domain-containing protein [Mobilitalea sp.]